MFYHLVLILIFFSSVSDNIFLPGLDIYYWMSRLVYLHECFVYFSGNKHNADYTRALLRIEILSLGLLLCQRFANLWLQLLRSRFFFFLVTMARFSFSPLDPLLQTGVNQYLHANSLQHQPFLVETLLLVASLAPYLYPSYLDKDAISSSAH